MSIKKIKQYISTPRLIFKILAHRRIFRLLWDSLAIKIMWKNEFGYDIDLNNPKTFNEKLQWLKLNFRPNILHSLVNKNEVKQYISQVLSKEYVIPTLAVWDSPCDITLKGLPRPLVIKTIDGGGGKGVLMIDKESKITDAEIRKYFLKNKKNAFYPGREWAYKGVPSQIIAEQMIGDGKLLDYKFFCFNGVVKIFKIDYNRTVGHRANYYDIESKEKLPFGEVVCPPGDRRFDLPDNFDKMVEVARKISSGFPFVRVDLYNHKGQIYFGEMTFYPCSGFGRFTDEKWDRQLGEWIVLSRI